MSNQPNSNGNKKFAIFITSYNYAEYIAQAIESVINQTDPDWNLFIIDNCSTDNTYEVVEKYLKKDDRISWKKREKNIGAIPNLINGFKEIEADYISTLQADDWLEPNFVADAKKAFTENPEIPLCALGWSACMYFPEKNQTMVQRAVTPLPKNFRGKIYLSPYIVFENFIAMHFLVFKKSCFMQIFPELEYLQFQQLLEPFLIKRLENIFGASFFDDSQSHGFWRRHIKQLTTTNNQSFQVEMERLSEPLFFCANNKNSAGISENLTNLATNFMSAVSCIANRKIPYRTATEWLLSDFGKPFAQNFANLNTDFIRANHLEKSLLCLAVCVWSSFIFNWGHALWEINIETAKHQLSQWIADLQNKYQLKNINEIFREANKLYDSYFMPLIK